MQWRRQAFLQYQTHEIRTQSITIKQSTFCRQFDLA